MRRDYEQLNEENGRLQTALDRANKEAQSKLDIYKSKTEQFQLQWKKRKDAEAMVKVKMFVCITVNSYVFCGQ